MLVNRGMDMRVWAAIGGGVGGRLDSNSASETVQNSLNDNWPSPLASYLHSVHQSNIDAITPELNATTVISTPHSKRIVHQLTSTRQRQHCSQAAAHTALGTSHRWGIGQATDRTAAAHLR